MNVWKPERPSPVVALSLALAAFVGHSAHNAQARSLVGHRGAVSATGVNRSAKSNGVIAFVGGSANASLDVIDPSGTHLRSLAYCATTGCYISDPVWSPNGRQIAFLRGTTGSHGDMHTGHFSVFVKNADGSGERRLVGCGQPVGCYGYSLSWAPDGVRLVVARSRSLFVFNLRTGGLRRLTNCGTSCVDLGPAWSSDGSKIAFSRSSGLCEGGCPTLLHIVNADGSGQKRLTNLRDDGMRPLWSPDGRSIAVGTYDGVYTVSSDGSHVRSLASGSNYFYGPNRPVVIQEPGSWSPDGTHILITSLREVGYSGRIALWVMHANGSGRRLLYHAAGDSRDPIWSPDGKHIAMSVNLTRPGQSGIYLMDANGSHFHRLLAGGFLELAWQPVP